MPVKSGEDRQILVEDDLIAVRDVVKRVVSLLSFSLINQTKVVTAASELARNTLEHGKGGHVLIQMVKDNDRIGIKMIFQDSGPGIEDVAQAMEDGFTTTSGMGLGLGGAKRLMDEFSIESKKEEGTRVTVTKWQEIT